MNPRMTLVVAINDRTERWLQLRRPSVPQYQRNTIRASGRCRGRRGAWCRRGTIAARHQYEEEQANDEYAVSTMACAHTICDENVHKQSCGTRRPFFGCFVARLLKTYAVDYSTAVNGGARIEGGMLYNISPCLTL